ncbi:DUF1203 domain-containing protein [Aestuariicoccus sp. MJ-SS9]|uniref:DUF1203 domain-containing protein n=1 Tax=Aestuariicoccus sp. MJ-SS9 TaxID=3079855 RepID=UPI00290D685C|nr:DUF1203 domain-containing protein [Aestuariicoccus sp. MJ-SS9]MDU8913960.1 DUF1203 domain-containing protein [Aestuariicoccus sp. MJ-SS9]
MAFQIQSLPAEAFAPLFDLSDKELTARNARRMIVMSKPGTPCRVSLADADIGETVILLNYRHQKADTPFQASHAIFVRKDAAQAHPAVNEVPEVLQSRLISLRLFNKSHMMIDADVVPGRHLGTAITDAFGDATVSYAHLHYAKPGCFAASVVRASAG